MSKNNNDKEVVELVVCVNHKRYKQDGEMLANHLNVRQVKDLNEIGDKDLALVYDNDGLSLVGGKLKLQGDFTSMVPRVKGDMWQHELIARAAKLKDEEGKLRAMDATAGLGEDSLILAAAGFEVTLYEQDPVIAALLKDALIRARKIPEIKDMVMRMKLVEGDSIKAMLDMRDCLLSENKVVSNMPDLIYLDPMFPERQKSSKIKKKFQLLQKLERPCFNGDEMVSAALSLNPKKIIIKRPMKAEILGNRKPEFSYKGTSIRYDCFMKN
jgi:16S rRNA (guanine1516-N2)-methyltransferase